MLLSLDILAHDLRDIVDSSDIRFSRRNLKRVRISEGHDNTTNGSLLLRETESGVLCTCESGRLLFKGRSLSQVLDVIQERFDFYNNWQMRLAKAVFGFSDWQEVVEVLYSAIGNPLYIVDRYGTMLGVTKQHIEDPITSLWLECAEKGRLVGSAFDKMHIFPLHVTAEIVLPNDETRCNYVQCPLFPNDPYSRVLYILEWKRPLSIRDAHIADTFQEMLSGFRGEDDRLSLSEVFEAVLRGENDDASILGWSLLQLGWQDARSFTLVGFAPRNADDEVSIKQPFLRELPTSIAMKDGEYSLVLIPSEDEGHVAEAFTHMPESKRLVCGMSSRFVDWVTLPERLDEVKKAIRCGRIANTPLSVYTNCGKSLIQAITQDLLRDEGLRHPAVAALSRHDERNHTELLRTLYMFLRLERKMAATAAELCIHRNTLVYRLQAIEKLFECDWDDFFERIHFVLSYEAFKEIKDRSDTEGAEPDECFVSIQRSHSNVDAS